jgi:hypothetical protein
MPALAPPMLRPPQEGEDDVSETPSQPGTSEGRDTPPPDPALTIPARRLAGSGHCLNCGTELRGPYCHHCGQPDRRFQRVLPVLLRDLLADLVDLDARFLRTLAPLLLRPGRVTREYLRGRRFRYTPPLRLYLFSSLVFFLLAALTGSDVVRAKAGPGDEPVIRFGLPGDEPPAAPAQPGAGAAEPEAEPDDEEVTILVNGRPWDRETNPVAIPFLPDFANGWINDEIEDSPRKARQIEQNPRLFTDQMRELLPGTMFVLLPLAALLFQCWHPLSGRYFVEHLIFALHAHAFTFVSMTLMLLFGAAQDLLGLHGPAWAASLAGLARALVATWVPVAFLLALKRVYGQGWPVTIVKFFGIGICYVVLLALTSATVAVVSFVLL